MKFNSTDIEECYLITAFSHADERGDFVKFYNSVAYNKNELDFQIKEIYYSSSKKRCLEAFIFKHLLPLTPRL